MAGVTRGVGSVSVCFVGFLNRVIPGLCEGRHLYFFQPLTAMFARDVNDWEHIGIVCPELNPIFSDVIGVRQSGHCVRRCLASKARNASSWLMTLRLSLSARLVQRSRPTRGFSCQRLGQFATQTQQGSPHPLIAAAGRASKAGLATSAASANAITVRTTFV